MGKPSWRKDHAPVRQNEIKLYLGPEDSRIFVISDISEFFFC